MNVTKKAILVAAAGVASTGVVTATAMAATNTGSNTYPPIVQKLADKFHLNPADVQDVFKQNHQDKKGDRQAHLKSVLDQAVKDKKLTQAQEDKLIAKLKSLRTELKSENHQDRKSLHDQLEQWAKDNGINNLDDILPQPPQGMRHHPMDQ